MLGISKAYHDQSEIHIQYKKSNSCTNFIYYLLHFQQNNEGKNHNATG